VVHPTRTTENRTPDSFADYYDSIHHAAVVVGINTSAMIEAAAVGRGVHVLLPERYRATQRGSLHFQHLQQVGGGLVVATEGMEEHARGLAAALRGDDDGAAAERARSFLAAFIRPNGLDRPATPFMVQALRNLASAATEPAGPAIDDVAATLWTTLHRDRSTPTGRKRRPRGGGRSEPVASEDVPSA
jgi:hypothetical protein